VLSRGHIRRGSHTRTASADLGSGHRCSEALWSDARSNASGQVVGADAKTDALLASLHSGHGSCDPHGVAARVPLAAARHIPCHTHIQSAGAAR
jgi:hypothetical protein